MKNANIFKSRQFRFSVNNIFSISDLYRTIPVKNAKIFNPCDQFSSFSSFLSNLVTAVLTHHLSWVNTVVSSEKDSKKCGLNKHTSSMVSDKELNLQNVLLTKFFLALSHIL